MLSLLAPDTVRRVRLHPGVHYRYLWSPSGPWAVHLVDARVPDRCELGLDVLRAETREAGQAGRERVSEMVSRADDDVLVAVNADFFTAAGMPIGTEVSDGVLHARGTRPLLAWRGSTAPFFGTAPVDDAEVRPAWPRVGRGAAATEVVAGFPDLVDAGMRVGDLEVAARPSFAAARHPRTAVGYDDDGLLWLVVVDGRQAPHSAGMTLPELATLLQALGADEALNLDGGGSTTMVVGGRPVNRPSDATGERRVVNALALVRNVDACRER